MAAPKKFDQVTREQAVRARSTLCGCSPKPESNRSTTAPCRGTCRCSPNLLCVKHYRKACAAHARPGPASLVLYDASTHYFETGAMAGLTATRPTSPLSVRSSSSMPTTSCGPSRRAFGCPSTTYRPDRSDTTNANPSTPTWPSCSPPWPYRTASIIKPVGASRNSCALPRHYRTVHIRAGRQILTAADHYPMTSATPSPKSQPPRH